MSEDIEIPYCNSNKIEIIVGDAVALSICFFVLCVVCVFGWIAIRKIYVQKRVIQSFKWTLYAAILCAFLGICSAIVMNVICMGVMPRFDETFEIFSLEWCIGGFAYLGMMLCLLINLFLRLDVTFGESALAMSTTKRRSFLTLIILEILSLAGCILVSTVSVISGGISFVVTGITLFCLFWIMYVLISFALVREFNNNLMKMAKFCVGPSQNISNLKLNVAQRQKVNLSAKYLALYFVAAATSVICGIPIVTSIMGLYVGPHQIGLTLGPIDACVNICCLVLQYACMNPVYTKFCRHIDGYCRDLTAGLMKRRVRQILHERVPSESIEGEHVEESGHSGVLVVTEGSSSDSAKRSTTGSVSV